MTTHPCQRSVEYRKAKRLGYIQDNSSEYVVLLANADAKLKPVKRLLFCGSGV